MPYWPLGTEKSVRHLEQVVFLLCCIAAVDPRALCTIFMLKLADYRSGITFDKEDITLTLLYYWLYFVNKISHVSCIIATSMTFAEPRL